MNKLILIITCVFALLATMVWAEEIKVSGEMWNRWTMENGTTPGDTLNAEMRQNFFSLERGYVGLETKFTDNIKGRFTVDIFSTDALKDGAGLKLK